MLFQLTTLDDVPAHDAGCRAWPGEDWLCSAKPRVTAFRILRLHAAQTGTPTCIDPKQCPKRVAKGTRKPAMTRTSVVPVQDKGK